MSLKHFLRLLATALCCCSGTASAAIVFEGATIIAFNDTTNSIEVLRDASMLVEDDRITALAEGSLSSLPANTIHVNATEKIISPGFIDTHHHLWQTAYKTLASNTSLAEYFQRYGEYSQAEQYFTPDDLYVGQLTGALELLYEGTTTVLDHAHASWSNETTDACVNATFDSGVRTFYAHTVHEIPNGWPWEAQLGKLQALAAESRFAQNNHTSLVSLGLGWDAFYLEQEHNITALLDLTKSNNLSVVTTHYLGGPFGFSNSPSTLSRYGWLDGTIPVIFSHASFIDWENAELLRNTNQYISTTPESEFHFGHNHPYAHLVQDQASIGIDCHFTFSSSLVTQARMWLQTLRWPNYLVPLENFQVPRKNPMSVNQAFHLITRAGAEALRRDDLGAIKVGAKADINIFRTDAPNMIGWSDPIAAIILHSDVGDIEDVLVNGKYVKKGAKLLYPDYDNLRKRLAESAAKIQKIWLETEWDALEGSISDESAPYGETVIIDTQRGDGDGYGTTYNSVAGKQ